MFRVRDGGFRVLGAIRITEMQSFFCGDGSFFPFVSVS